MDLVLINDIEPLLIVRPYRNGDLVGIIDHRLVHILIVSKKTLSTLLSASFPISFSIHNANHDFCSIFAVHLTSLGHSTD
jgi:hypothetical protein